MINYVAYRKFVTLKNGKRVMFRFLNEQDREALIQMFQEAPEEDIRFLKQDVKDQKLVNAWVDTLDYRKVLPLVAVDLERLPALTQALRTLAQTALPQVQELAPALTLARGRASGGGPQRELVEVASFAEALAETTALKDVAEQAWFKEKKLFQVFVQQLLLPNAKSPNLGMPNAVQLNKALTVEIQNVLQGKKNTKQALDDAAAEWNKVLAQYQQ